MRNYIDENDKKNEVRLLFNHPSYKDKVIIIVEGGSDVRFFRHIIQNENIKIQAIDGKKDLIKVMEGLILEFPQRVLAVCDADQDHLLNNEENRNQYSIYITDYHDAEMMMIKSEALRSFVDEYSSFENVDSLHACVLGNSLDASYLIGILRWINSDENLNLNFKGLNFGEFIDIEKSEINVNLDILIEVLLKRSKSISESVTDSYLKEKLDEYTQKQGCKLQVCCGHDVANIIAMIYRQRWASVDLNMNCGKVESSLRMCYQRSFFKDTKLFLGLSTKLRGIGIELQMC